MARGFWAALVAVALVMTAGCGWAKPRWFFPGAVERQQNRAVAHDPYPDNQAGPEIVGGRPREYSEQLPEAVRSQPQLPGVAPGGWYAP